MITCLFLFCFAFGFWCGRTCKRLKKSKFIIFSVFLIMIVSRETFADEIYNLDGTYSFYDSSSNTYDYSMPTQRFYPGNDYSSPVVQNVTLGATSYQLKQIVDTSGDLDNSTVLGSTVISGTRQGWLSGYKQTFKYVTNVEDKYQLHFNISQRRGGSGQAKLYYYTDNGWVLAYTDTIDGTTYSSGDVETAFNIKGWMVEIDYTLNSGFAFLRADDQYAEGYRLNDFYFGIKNSQEVAEETQEKIEENTRQTNGLLGTIKDKIDSIITSITNLPQTILNGIHSLFVPDDIQSDFEDILETLHDDLGVLALPIDFIHSVCSAITDTTTTVFPVHTPAFKYDNKTIFPAYDRDNILYFGSLPVFGNVGASSWFDNLMSKVGINRNMTIMQCIQAFMKLIIFIGIIRYIYNIVYEYYHMDFDDEVGGADL